MKYIRTKDGIYKGNEDWYRQCYCFEPIIKQADTIEELCDVFIIIDEDKKINIYLKEDGWTFGMMQDLGMWSDRTCYGAVWTYDDIGSPTLKSVAKMNDKGELELL